MADHIMLTSRTSIAGFEVPAQLSYSSHLGQVQSNPSKFTRCLHQRFRFIRNTIPISLTRKAALVPINDKAVSLNGR